MTGGGLYAVNKLAKTAEHRHNNSLPQPNPQYYSRDNGVPNQGYWAPPGPPPRDLPQVDSRYVDYQDRRQYNTGSNPNDARYAQGFSAADYEAERYTPVDGDYQYRSRQTVPPPSYYPQQGYVKEPRDQVYEQNRGLGSPVAGLAGMAMQFVGSGRDSGNNGKKLEKMSEFFGK